MFALRCCREKQICTSCLQCLHAPLCPFCRSVIPEIQNDPRYHCSQSFIEVSHFLIIEQARFLADHNMIDDSIDPRIIDSRILRRRIRRIRRLQYRERASSQSD